MDEMQFEADILYMCSRIDNEWNELQHIVDDGLISESAEDGVRRLNSMSEHLRKFAGTLVDLSDYLDRLTGKA